MEKDEMKEAILVSGGAGFVGSNLSIHLKQKFLSKEIIALDNLKRRGSELNLNRLKQSGVNFIHGDIRNKEDLFIDKMKISLIIDCSAEPSVLAGFNNSPEYVVNVNLIGAINCLELARRHKADFIFLSTSRVYPVQRLNALNLGEDESRFILLKDQKIPGTSLKGIDEGFPMSGIRSLYGATKLAAELLINEYIEMYGLRAIINRCGVISGPWQMGKIDQGVFALWMAAHYFKKEINYIGFGGKGKQVRDLLHILDLCELVDIQIQKIERLNGHVFNVGGGLEMSLSLREATELCQRITGNHIKIGSISETRPADVKWYITDNSRVFKATGWQPKIVPERTLVDIFEWVKDNEDALKDLLGA